jgi:hypothetical protein
MHTCGGHRFQHIMDTRGITRTRESTRAVSGAQDFSHVSHAGLNETRFGRHTCKPRRSRRVRAAQSVGALRWCVAGKRLLAVLSSGGRRARLPRRSFFVIRGGKGGRTRGRSGTVPSGHLDPNRLRDGVETDATNYNACHHWLTGGSETRRKDPFRRRTHRSALVRALRAGPADHWRVTGIRQSPALWVRTGRNSHPPTGTG